MTLKYTWKNKWVGKPRKKWGKERTEKNVPCQILKIPNTSF